MVVQGMENKLKRQPNHPERAFKLFLVDVLCDESEWSTDQNTVTDSLTALTGLHDGEKIPWSLCTVLHQILLHTRLILHSWVIDYTMWVSRGGLGSDFVAIFKITDCALCQHRRCIACRVQIKYDSHGLTLKSRANVPCANMYIMRISPWHRILSSYQDRESH